MFRLLYALELATMTADIQLKKTFYNESNRVPISAKT